MEFSIINPIKSQVWDEWVVSFPNYTFFHSSDWAKVIYDTYRYSLLYYAVVDNGKPIALIPAMEVKSFLTGNRCVSLPFSDFCGPLLTNGVLLKDVFDFMIEESRFHNWKYIEMKCGYSAQENIPVSLSYFHHIVELKEKEELMMSLFRDSTRRNITKAKREGLTVRFSSSREDVITFYRLLCMTRKKHGVPPQPFRFFKNIYQHIISKKLGYVVLADYNNTSIAGGVFFHIGEKTYFKFGALDPKYQHQRASYLIIWEAMKWYALNGYSLLSLGRTHPDHSGLMQFKNGWGAQKQLITYHKYNLEKNAYVADFDIPSSMFMLFKKMPIPVLKLIGNKLYRHIG